MSLLTDLKEAAPTATEESKWALLRRVLPVLVPGLEVTKVTIFGDGRLGMRGKSPMQGKGKHYFVLTMDPVRDGRPDGTREVRLGIAVYRDEADARLYDRPFRVFLKPEPGMVTAWLVGVLMTEDVHSERRRSALEH